jgi:hypothetical protein
MAASQPDRFRFFSALTFLMDIVYTPVMDKNKPIDYMRLVQKEYIKLQKLLDERDELDLQIAKSRQLVAATANMLDDKHRDSVLKNMALIQQGRLLAETSLTEGIRQILQKHAGVWLTVTQTRDRLEVAGFDFSGYRSSPLASISTTLKRFSSFEVERGEFDGVAAYRWIEKDGAKPLGPRVFTGKLSEMK